MNITTRIEVPSHLKEYCIGRFNEFVDGPIRFPDILDLYHMIFDLTIKRPANCPVDKGNLEIILPNRDIGKSPSTYNYLSETAQNIITKKIEVMMWAEVHDLLDYNRHQEGLTHLESVHIFVSKYGIVSISEDAFIKNYYRWRESVRSKKRKRSYKK